MANEDAPDALPSIVSEPVPLMLICGLPVKKRIPWLVADVDDPVSVMSPLTALTTVLSSRTVTPLLLVPPVPPVPVRPMLPLPDELTIEPLQTSTPTLEPVAALPPVPFT